MSDPSHHPRWLLRRGDQVAVAALVVVALLAMVGWWIAHGGWSGRLIEIDQAEPLTARFEVDINTADWPELMQLPGIGPKLAQRIVESRQTDGPFADPDDLRRVQGIGQRSWSRFAPTCGPCPTARTPQAHSARRGRRRLSEDVLHERKRSSATSSVPLARSATKGLARCRSWPN